jgi:hypothetical protein
MVSYSLTGLSWIEAWNLDECKVSAPHSRYLSGENCFSGIPKMQLRPFEALNLLVENWAESLPSPNDMG